MSMGQFITEAARRTYPRNIYDIEPGSIAFFPQGVPHMVWNDNDKSMHLVCFYAPDEKAVGYEFFEDFDFPEFKK